MAWPSTAASTPSCGPLHDRPGPLSRLTKIDVASRSTKLVGSLTIVVFLLLVFEVFSFIVFHVTKEDGAFHLRVHYPAELTDAEFRDYINIRHDKLGWPPKNDDRLDNGSHGERISPANDAIADPKYCFEVYGDSFTFAADINDDPAWPNRLAAKIKCKVLNFGISGYGVDQAVLRHELNERFANYAALLIYPHDIRRNLNQQRSLVWPQKSRPNFKPRFILSSDGSLELIEIFSGTLEDYKRVIADPSSGLHEERFLPESDGTWSKIMPTFPYTFSILRLVRKIYREIDFEKVWAGEFQHGIRSVKFPYYYLGDDKLSTEAKRILEKLAERFQNNCKAKRQTCFVILHPDGDYLEGDFRAEKMMAYYFENLRTLPNFLDMTDFLRTEMKGDFCRYIGQDDNCQGHFNEAGNEIVSEFFLHTFPAAFEN